MAANDRAIPTVRKKDPMTLMDAGQSVLMIVDVQERLAPAINDLDRVVAAISKLAAGAERLGIPVIVSEQYPSGLGSTIPAIRDRLGAPTVVEKTAFDAMAEPALGAALDRIGRTDVVICGTETHVCVLQTAFGLNADGRYRPVVVEDGCGSRHDTDRDRALKRMDRAGIEIVTAEMVLFEWMRRAGTETFRDIIKVIK